MRIGISIGDINGIGLEVILKTVSHKNITEVCTPVIYGSTKIVSYHKNIVGIEDFKFQGLRDAYRLHNDKINIVNCWQDSVNITLGKVSETGGKYAMMSLDRAVGDLRNGLIDAVVTAPINKQAMGMANFKYPGHTEYFTKEFEAKDNLMFMITDDVKIGLVTNHVPITKLGELITKGRILRKLRIMNETLKMDFGLERPSIAVLGLNPHAGDGGVLGKEEETIIRPAIIEAKKKGMMVFGPYAADSFFGSSTYRKFDAILAMYHDQGLIPFKTLAFGSGVNYTAGLPIVRTSPDHGTGFDIVGQNKANPASFRQAVYAAVDIARNRKDFIEMHENPIVKRTKDFKEDDLTAGALKEDVNENAKAKV
ncbi:MAG: 4-hydroxythreonine-4-phosphate dehydrogenase PdxA [Bacteroidota bacterium]